MAEVALVEAEEFEWLSGRKELLPPEEGSFVQLLPVDVATREIQFPKIFYASLQEVVEALNV